MIYYEADSITMVSGFSVWGDSIFPDTITTIGNTVTLLEGEHIVDGTITEAIGYAGAIIRGVGTFSNLEIAEFGIFVIPTATDEVTPFLLIENFTIIAGVISVNFEFTIISESEYSKVDIESVVFEPGQHISISLDTDGLLADIDGPLFVMSKSSPFLLGDVMFHELSVDEGSLITSSSGLPYVASYQIPSPFSTMSNTLSFVKAIPPTAVDDTCNSSCQTPVGCKCCVNVIINDISPHELTLSVILVGNLFTVTLDPDAETVCYFPSSIPSTIIQQYYVEDSNGLPSALADIVFTITIPDPSASSSPSPSSSASASSSISESSSASISESSSLSASASASATASPSSSISESPSVSLSASASASSSISESSSASISESPSPSPSSSSSASSSISESSSASVSESPSVSSSKSSSISSSPTASITESKSASLSQGASATSSPSLSDSASVSPSHSESSSSSVSKSPTSSASVSRSPSGSTSILPSKSSSSTSSSSKSSSATPSSSSSPSPSPSPSISKSITNSKSSTRSITTSVTKTSSGTTSPSRSETASGTSSSTATDTPSPTSSASTTASSSSSLDASLVLIQNPVISIAVPSSSNFPSVPPSIQASSSPIVFPTSSEVGACINCQFGGTEIPLNEDGYDYQYSGNGDIVVDLTTNDGTNVGGLLIPPNLLPTGSSDATLDVSFVFNESPQDNRIPTVIFDITLTDSSGNAITSLDAPLVVCIDATEDVSIYSNKFNLIVFNKFILE